MAEPVLRAAKFLTGRVRIPVQPDLWQLVLSLLVACQSLQLFSQAARDRRSTFAPPLKRDFRLLCSTVSIDALRVVSCVSVSQFKTHVLVFRV